MATTISCRCCVDDGGVPCSVRLDVRLNGIPEVWMRVTEEGGTPRAHGSAVWRLGRWTVLSGESGFAPQKTLDAALRVPSWPEEPPAERRGEVLDLLRTVAAAG